MIPIIKWRTICPSRQSSSPFPTVITNLEAEQNANLSIGLRLVPVPENGEVVAEVFAVPVTGRSILHCLSLRFLEQSICLQGRQSRVIWPSRS